MKILKVFAVLVAVVAMLLAQVTSIPSGSGGGFSGTIDASQVVSGRLVKARQHDQTVYADQTITYSSSSDQDMRTGKFRPPSGLFSAIPAASSVPGGYYIITDGGGVNCGSGSGSTPTVCWSNGTSWVILGTIATANPTVTFTSQTSVTFTHNLNTDTPIVQCYDASGSRLWIEPSQITSTSSNVSTITFAASQSGKCVANSTGGGGGGGGGSGTVTSVAMTVPAWLGLTGSPITTSGTLALTLASASGARTAILPSYSGNAGKVLAVNGGATDVEWVAGGGGGGGVPGGGVVGQTLYNSASGTASWIDFGRGVEYKSDGNGTRYRVTDAVAPMPLSGTVTWDPTSISAGTQTTQTVTVTGAQQGDSCQTGIPPGVKSVGAGLVIDCVVTTANTVTIYVDNNSGSSRDPAPTTAWTVLVQKSTWSVE